VTGRGTIRPPAGRRSHPGHGNGRDTGPVTQMEGMGHGLEKKYFKLLQAIHHAEVIEETLHSRRFPLGMMRQVNKLTQFIKPSSPNEETTARVRSNTHQWMEANMQILKLHYDRVITLLLEGSLPFSQIALDEALLFGRKRYQKKLTARSVSTLTSMLTQTPYGTDPGVAPLGLPGWEDQWPPLPAPAHAEELLHPAWDSDLGTGAAFLLDPGPVLQTRGVPDPVSYSNHNHSPRVPLRLDTRSTREQASRTPKSLVCPAADRGTWPPFWPLPKPQRARNIVVTDALIHWDPEGAISALPSIPLALTPFQRGAGIDLGAGGESLLDSRIGEEELAAEIAPEGWRLTSGLVWTCGFLSSAHPAHGPFGPVALPPVPQLQSGGGRREPAGLPAWGGGARC